MWLCSAALAWPERITDSVTGLVRDSGGNPVEGVTITASTVDRTPVTTTAVSDRDGEYKFPKLARGTYVLALEKAGYVASEKRQTVIEENRGAAVENFTIARTPLKFEAAGVRGLIDPGGYSAPAQAASASGVIAAMATIQRGGNLTAVRPCGLEEPLTSGIKANDNSLSAGALLLARGRFAEARATLSPLAEASTDAKVYRLLAQALEGLGLFTDASEAYRSAAERDPSEDSLFGVGYELILAGSVDGATNAFRAGLKVHQGSAKLWLGLGTAEFLAGQAADSVSSFLHAVDCEPSDLRAYEFLDKSFSASGAEAERVTAAFERFTRLAPANAAGLCYYAGALMRDPTKTSAAEAILKRAINIDPGLALAHFRLASLFSDRGDYSSAAREYATTLALAPELADAHYRLAMVYRKLERDDLAATQLKTFEAARDRRHSEVGGSAFALDRFVSVLSPAASQPQPAPPCPPAPR